LYGIDAKQSNLQERNIFKEIENISFMTFTAFTNTQSPLNTHICAGHLSRRPKIYISYMSRTHHIITIVSTIFFLILNILSWPCPMSSLHLCHFNSCSGFSCHRGYDWRALSVHGFDIAAWIKQKTALRLTVCILQKLAYSIEL